MFKWVFVIGILKTVLKCTVLKKVNSILFSSLATIITVSRIKEINYAELMRGRASSISVMGWMRNNASGKPLLYTSNTHT